MFSDAFDFTKFMTRGSNGPMLSDNERKKARILVVDTDPNVRNTMRQALVSLGFMSISDAQDKAMAMAKLEDNQYSHVIFDVRKGAGAAKDFLTALLEHDDRIVAIPASYDPTIDDVFDLLLFGARGYLVKPFTSGSVDEAIAWASKGEPISDSILYARSRNEALTSLVLTTLDKLAIIMAQSRQFETARRELPKRTLVFKRSVEVAMTFAEGGSRAIFEQLMAYCLERAEGPATRLGSVRRRIADMKSKKSSEKPARNTETTHLF